jgi:hypothetical protein
VFSTAMTAWAAKFVTSAICLFVKGRTSWRDTMKAPISSSSLNIGTARAERMPPSSTAATTVGSRRSGVGFVRCSVYDVHDLFAGHVRRAKGGDASVHPGAYSQIRFCKRGSPNVRFTPKATELLPRRETTRRATAVNRCAIVRQAACLKSTLTSAKDLNDEPL